MFWLSLRRLLFHFGLFCFHRFVSVWQCRVISLFTALQASFPQCSSVTERLSFFPWVKYQMTMWTNPWYFQIKFVFLKKNDDDEEELKSELVTFFTFAFTGSFLSLWSVRCKALLHSSHCDYALLDQSRCGRVWTNEGGGEVDGCSVPRRIVLMHVEQEGCQCGKLRVDFWTLNPLTPSEPHQ